MSFSALDLHAVLKKKFIYILKSECESQAELEMCSLTSLWTTVSEKKKMTSMLEWDQDDSPLLS